MFNFLSALIDSTAGSTLLLPLAVALGALFFEDVTTIIAGVLSADGILPAPVAFIALYVGIALGDTALYLLGAYARTHPRLAKYINHDFTAPFKSWLEHRYAFKVFSGHFIPGFRFTTFVASGFFRFPLRTYIPMAVLGGLILETALFTIAYVFGNFTATWIGPVRWGVAAAFIAALLIIARHNYLAYRAHKNGADTETGAGS